MSSYYVHTVAQENGDHEVHVSGCSWMPDTANRKYLGEFSNCAAAVVEAKKTYWKSDGCHWCCPECDKS